MSIDGTQVLSTAATLPSRALIGFTGATGGVVEQHEVGNATATGLRYLARPALAITTRVVAPAGSNQAAGRADSVGRCTADFAASDQGNGDVARPGLSGAPAGQPCDVGVFVPPGSHWTVKAAGGERPRAVGAGPRLLRGPARGDARQRRREPDRHVHLDRGGDLSAPPAKPKPPAPVADAPSAPPRARRGLGLRRAARAGRRDVTGHGHDGVIQGARRVVGRFGRALYFNGIDGWVTVPDSPALRLPLADARGLGASGGPRLGVAQRDRQATREQDGVRAVRASRPRCRERVGGPARWSLVGRPRLRPGVWTHLALSYDGARLRAILSMRYGLRPPRRAGGWPADRRRLMRFGGGPGLSSLFRGQARRAAPLRPRADAGAAARGRREAAAPGAPHGLGFVARTGGRRPRCRA